MLVGACLNLLRLRSLSQLGFEIPLYKTGSQHHGHRVILRVGFQSETTIRNDNPWHMSRHSGIAFPCKIPAISTRGAEAPSVAEARRCTRPQVRAWSPPISNIRKRPSNRLLACPLRQAILPVVRRREFPCCERLTQTQLMSRPYRRDSLTTQRECPCLRRLDRSRRMP